MSKRDTLDEEVGNFKVSITRRFWRSTRVGLNIIVIGLGIFATQTVSDFKAGLLLTIMGAVACADLIITIMRPRHVMPNWPWVRYLGLIILSGVLAYLLGAVHGFFSLSLHYSA